MSWIVVEALDGVGKTTLCAGLARALGAGVMDTPGPELRPVREQILQALGPDEAARALFYAATVRAEGVKARAAGPVVMDRYWLSTRAYGTARGARLPWSALEAILPAPDVTLLLTLNEQERRRRLGVRGCSAADRETLEDGFRARVDACWLGPDIPPAFRPVVVDMTGADPEVAVRRALAAVAEALTSLRCSSSPRG